MSPPATGAPSAGVSSASLWGVFRTAASSFVDRPAVRATDGALTFAELYAAADRTAVALARAGLPEGSFVGYAAENALGFVPTVLALWRHGAGVGLLSTKYGPSELASIARGARPLAIVLDAGLAEGWGRTLGWRSVTVERPLPARQLALLLPRSSGAVPGAPEAAVVKFTSGSTAEPKGVVLRADNVLAEARSVARTLELRPGDQILAPVPLFHSYGFDLGLLGMLVSGATLVLPDVFIARRLIAELGGGSISVLLGVPSVYRTFVDTALSSVPTLSKVRYLLSCTAPLPPSLILAFHERFGAPICQHYGSSEAGAVATHVPGAVLGRLDSVGRAQADVTITIVGDNGRALPPGTEGEVVVQSPAVASGYVMGAPSASALYGGRCRMGDTGVLDADGFLRVRGRKDELINVGGLKVSPLEVQQVLERHPHVREAAVVGIPGAAEGEQVVCAVVVLRHRAAEAELIEWCREQLAEYKVPRRIDIQDELPRGPTGKVRLTAADVRL